MTRRRIKLEDLVPARARRWKLFRSNDDSPPPAIVEPPLEAPPYPVAPASVLHQLNECNRRLEHLLRDLRNEHNAEGELRDIAREVLQAVATDRDIALASILLNQIAGSYAVRHCIETAVVAVLLAQGMERSAHDLLTLAAAALTMNVGMLRHHDTFQHKHLPLTPEEKAIVRRHPEDSADLLKCAGIEDEEWISCVLLHHEHEDGSGYPAGVARPEVTLNAKLISVADRYCAQVSARNYRRSVLPDQAMRNLLADGEAPLDPLLAGQLARELGDYPPGSLVRLQNGEIGVVARRGDAPGRLDICALRDGSGGALPAATVRHSGDADCAIREALSEDQAGLRFSMKQVWGEQASL